jgi:hypothetical protein
MATDEQRDVPRDDADGDAHRLLADQHGPERAGPVLFERERADQLGEAVEHHRRREDLAHQRPARGRAHLGGDRVGELLGPGLDGAAQLGDPVGALVGAELGVGPVERGLRGLDRPVDVGLARLGHGGDDLFGER